MPFLSDKELRALLKPQADATHLRDQTISPPQVTFLTGTRRDTRKLVSSWAESELVWNSHICWVTGAAGAGKSTIAQVVAETFEQKKKLAGSYFWSSTTDERSDALRLVMTLAYELATYIPKTAPHIRAVLSREPDLLNTNISLSTQLDKLVLNPCKAVFQKSSIMRSLGALKGPFVFVLDGIDKCHDVPRTIDLLDCIIGFFGQNPTIPIRFLITGRIPGSLALCAVRQEVFQIDLSNFAPKEDVADFIMASLAQCPVNPPSAADIESLTTLSNGSFSVAAPLVQFILSTSLPLTNTRLDPFYSRVLAEAGDLPYFMDILSALTLLKTPMSISGLAGLLELPYHALAKVLNQLSGIVNVPPWDDKPISFITTDVREFLLDQSRSHSFHVQLSFLRSVAFTSLDKIIAHLDRLSEDQWMLPLKGPVSIAVTEWAKHLELVREADPSFDMSGFDARWIWILSRFQVLPHFPSIIAMLALAQEPLQVSDLCTVLNIGIPDISLLLYALGPLMWRITKSPKTINLGDRVRFRHQAIIDFLIDKSRAQGLAVDPCQYTYIGQRYMDIVFGLHSSSNNKSFVVNWPRILALAVREDGDFERVFVEEAFNPVTREQRAYLDSAQSWNDARTITLEAAEMELLRSNIQGAIQSVEQTVSEFGSVGMIILLIHVCSSQAPSQMLKRRTCEFRKAKGASRW